jgi:hypothetical protein
MAEAGHRVPAPRGAEAAFTLLFTAGAAWAIWPAHATAGNPASPQSFQPVPGLAPIPSGRAALDLHVTDTTEWIIVNGKRRPHGFPESAAGGDTPDESQAAIPRAIRIAPPTSCPNEAYQTIAGQPATANDLVGFLGSGDCH